MLKFLVPAFLVALMLPSCAAPSPVAVTTMKGDSIFSTVFSGGEEGFPTVRIPSIVCIKSGALVAFAEGRRNMGDQAENKIIARRSTDGGKTWLPLQIVADDGLRPLNNPCAVVDQKTGRLLVMFQSYPKDLKEASGGIKTGYDGDDIVKSYIVRSDDEGATWGQMEEVTRSVKRPTGVTTVASGPGIGIQLKRGAHAGRLLMPFNEGPFGKWNIYTAYSDDGGKSWQYGDNVPEGAGQVNECQIAELSDGRIYFNSRSGGGAKVRRISFSDDGGVTWSPVKQEPQLIESRCMASVLSYEDSARHRLIYSGPRTSTGRDTGTVYVSYDDGKTWPVHKLLEPGMFGYSNLVQFPDGTLGCLYEANDYNNIVFKTFSLQWLTDGADAFGRKPNKTDDLALVQTRLQGDKPAVWLITGDSITHGAQHTKGQRSYPELFEQRIRFDLGRSRDAVVNTGISGDTADGILADFNWRVAQFHPDVVSINIGMNDCVKGAANRAAFESQLGDLVRLVRAGGAVPVLCTTTSTQGATNRTDLPAYNDIIKRVADADSVILVDNWAHWQKAPKEWFSDAIHPGARGHVEMVNTFFQTLKVPAK
ncbi:hypothetical protein EON83_11420 [bacterium]|nr:MAG: hypothetical protein EON83_11420 [bacterium]